MLPRQRHQCFSELLIFVRLCFVAICRAVHTEEPAGMTFAQLILIHQLSDIPPRAYKLQPFFRITDFSASLSRLRSATISFSRRFSSSSVRSFFASLTSMPLYFDFQLYSVWSVTPTSRANAFADRPASSCFTAAMIFSSLCFVFFI